MMMRQFKILGGLFFLLLTSAKADTLNNKKFEISSSSTALSFTAYQHFFNGYFLQQQGDAIGALREYSDILRLYPDVANIYRERARLYLSLGNKQGALEDIQKILDKKPTDPDSYLLTANIYMELGKKEDATKTLYALLKKNPNHTQAVLFLSSILGKEDWRQAVNVLEDFRLQNPADIDVLNRLAIIYETNDQQQKAEKIFAAIVRLAPDSLIALAWQARQAYDKKQIDQAIVFYEQLLEKTPENESLRNHLVLLCGMQKQYAKIISLLAPYNKNPQASLENLKWLASSYEILGQNTSALENYDLLLQKKEDPDLRFHMSYLYGMESKPQKALDLLQPLLKQNPQDLKLRYMRALAYKDLKLYKKSLKDLNFVLDAKPKHILALFQKAVVLDFLGRSLETETILEYIVNIDSSIPIINNYLGYTWTEKNKNLPQARILIEHALKHDPDNPSYLDSMGWLCFKEGHLQTAKEYLMRASEKEEDATICEHLGDVFTALSDSAWAAFYYDKALKLKPKNEPIQKKYAQAQQNKIIRLQALDALQKLSDMITASNNISGTLILRLRAGPAQILASALGQGSFYLRRLSDNVSETMELKVDLAQNFPNMPISFYYRTPPQERWTVFPQEMADTVGNDCRTVFEVVTSYFSADLLRFFDSETVKTSAQDDLFILSTDTENLAIHKKDNSFARWSLADMELSVQKYQDVVGQKFPQILRLKWKSDSKNSDWNILDIELRQISFDPIADSAFE